MQEAFYDVMRRQGITRRSFLKYCCLAAGAPINMERLNYARSIAERAIAFIKNVYIPDVVAIGSFYKGWIYGGGNSGQNILSYGDIPDRANDYSAGNLMMPRGAIINGNLSEVHEVDLRDPTQVQEFVPHSWYNYADENVGLHPWDGVTEANFKLGPNHIGTKTDIRQIDESGKYSWIKAPRGALGHWIKIKDTKIENYQCVVPTTWNGSPRDNVGNIGAFEASLMNTKIEVPEEPVEILRTLHSFDPCLACSTHVMSEDGEELADVKTR